MPQFRVVRHSARWHGTHHWRVSPVRAYYGGWYRDATPRLVYHPKNVRAYLNPDLRIGRNASYLLYALVHDTLHMYQVAKQPLGSDHAYWMEGVADAGAFDLIFGSKARRKQLLSIMNDFLGVSLQHGDLWGYFSTHFADALILLMRWGLIDTLALQEIPLPFSVPPPYQNRTRNIAEERSDGNVYDVDEFSYLIGSFRALRIVRQSDQTFGDLLRSPMSNRKLREYAQDLGEKRPG